VISLNDFRRAEHFGRMGYAIRGELRHIVHRCDGFQSDFKGMCAVASVAMSIAMTRIGARPVFVLGMKYYPWGSVEHCFLEWRGFVIDVTHSQFGAPDVLVDRREHIRGIEDAVRGPRARLAVDEWGLQSPRCHRGAILRSAAKALQVVA
jgi:hypothetical protein